MAIGELIGFAIGALRGHRLRTGLSVAGVAVGISAVIALRDPKHVKVCVVHETIVHCLMVSMGGEYAL